MYIGLGTIVIIVIIILGVAKALTPNVSIARGDPRPWHSNRQNG